MVLRLFTIIVGVLFAGNAIAAVALDDTRVALNKFKPKELPPITKEEARRIQKILGACTCFFIAEGTKKRRGSDASCFLAGNQGTNRDLNFNSHFARDYLDSNDRQNPGKLTCTFANKAGDAPVEFSFVPGTYRVGTMIEDDPINDKAILRLSAPLAGAVEMPVTDIRPLIYTGMPLYLFSAFQERMKVPVPEDQPIAQEVRVLKLDFDMTTGEVVSFATTGSAMAGTSGSLYAMRDADGGLTAVAMIHGAPADEKDKEPVYQTNPVTGRMLFDSRGKPVLNNAIIATPLDPSFTVEGY